MERLSMTETKRMIVTVLVEMAGSTIFSIFVLTTAKPSNQTADGMNITSLSVVIAVSLFITYTFVRPFSTGLFNPSIVLFRMFRKTDQISLKMGLILIICQFIGSITGGLLALKLFQFEYHTITQDISVPTQIRAFAIQVMAAFLFNFSVQFCIQKKMTFLEHRRQMYIAIPFIYLVVNEYSNSQCGINPALGFAFALSSSIQSGSWIGFKFSYIFTIAPFVGALAAIWFFQKVAKAMFPLKKQQIIRCLQLQLFQRQQQLLKCENEADVSKQNAIKYQINQQAEMMGIRLTRDFRISIQSQPEQNVLLTRTINHRWSLSDIIQKQLFTMPKDYTSNISHFLQNGNDEVDSIGQQQQIRLLPIEGELSERNSNKMEELQSKSNHSQLMNSSVRRLGSSRKSLTDSIQLKIQLQEESITRKLLSKYTSQINSVKSN